MRYTGYQGAGAGARFYSAMRFFFFGLLAVLRAPECPASGETRTAAPAGPRPRRPGTEGAHPLPQMAVRGRQLVVARAPLPPCAPAADV
jgi:hypothetical protein